QIPENWFQNKGSYDFKYFYSKNGRLYFTQDGYYFGRLDRIFYLVGDQMQEVKSPGSTHYFKGFHDEDGFLSAIDSYGDYYQWENTSIDPVIRKCIELGNPNYFQLIDVNYADGYTWVIDTQNRIYQLKGDSILKVNEVGDKNFGLIQLLPDPTKENIFWIASYGGGLLKWNYVTSKVEKTFTKDDGLPDNTIASMILDENGNIWMSTFNGVTQFDPQSERFTNYSTADGLIQSEFDRHHGFKLPDGRIAFGGTSGYSVFDPKLFVEDEFSPTVKLTRLEINYQEQIFGDSLSLLDMPLNELSDLDLSYSNNSVAFEYSAMQFNAPDKNLYRYKLSGYNDDWVINGTDRKIKFDKLRTGNYSLSLNASNTNGQWSSNIREIQIRVLPPPWLSWWAYTLYFLVAAGIIILFWRSYKSRLLKQQEVEFNRREALRLKAVDDMKTRFFSNITHEFRTPLTLILSPLEKQLRNKKYPEDVQKILESNYRHGSHLLKLVNELLDISKLESGFMQSHQSTGQLAVFLNAIIEDFNEMASQKEVDLSLELNNIDGYHQFDKGHLEKIVRNLLSNALKFTSQNGSVRLMAEVVENRELILEVHDTGIGIPEEQLSKLFDRFYQVDDTATRAFEGTGIGLSLVKELTDLMGGAIAVRSILGEGSVFRVEIPISIVLTSGELATETEKMATETLEGAPIVLVVEDNAELRSFIVESLTESAEVIAANNGKEGWSLILDRMPDIVVSDVMMPEMDGYELCQKTKSDARTSHIPIILLTAKSAQESKEKGLEAGADDYLTKPFHMYELELRIQNAFRQQNNLREFLRKDYLALNTEAKNPQTKDAFLFQLDSLLASNLTNEVVSVDWLASEMSMSQSTLNRKLKALLGFSAVEFIRQTRLQKAILLLASGQSISEVAYQVGFESPSYFSQCFKEVYHLTPTEYQQNNT
ncbi:MAG: signal transduction histidine kinase/DNA-binding response OmpR family regulator, partial [Marinoscillum sp.]